MGGEAYLSVNTGVKTIMLDTGDSAMLSARRLPRCPYKMSVFARFLVATDGLVCKHHGHS